MHVNAHQLMHMHKLRFVSMRIYKIGVKLLYDLIAFVEPKLMREAVMIKELQSKQIFHVVPAGYNCISFARIIARMENSSVSIKPFECVCM